MLFRSSLSAVSVSQAFVDMGKGTVTSDEHIDVKLLNGTLTADRLRITGGGEIVRFEGNVVMNLDNLSAGEASGEQAANASAAAAEPAQPAKTRSMSGKSANPR